MCVCVFVLIIHDAGVCLGPSHRQAVGTYSDWSQAVDHLVGMATSPHVRIIMYIQELHVWLRC